jgi:hypothetical protein
MRLAIAVFLLCTPARAELTVEFVNDVGCRVENSYFVADLTERVMDGKLEDSGVLRALTIKAQGVTLLRTRNRMHWAPSFQRAGAKSYTSVATWHPVQESIRDRKPDRFVFTRKGRHQDYPEIALEATYEFPDDAPYFLFHSVMTIEKPIEMYWLRNQEMTMDAFFTHVSWPGADGRPVIRRFEDRAEALPDSALPADVPWICFLNPEKGYGYGAVVLDYRATTTLGPKTMINDGAENGRYWDRHLISRRATPLRPGDRYEERTAYVVVSSSVDEPLADFLKQEREIRAKYRNTR